LFHKLIIFTIQTANISFEIVAKVKYLEMTNKNGIYEEIKSRLN
jgi:hypothetical protein